MRHIFACSQASRGNSRIDPAAPAGDDLPVRSHASVCARLTAAWLGAGLVFASVTASLAANYEIDHIEILDNKYVTIHFDTVANRTYTLQYRTSLNSSNGSLTAGWTNLFTAPSQPFPNHYVVADFRTNRVRYYRLRVTP